MSEAVIITSNPLNGERIAGSVGYPLPGVDLRIAGELSPQPYPSFLLMYVALLRGDARAALHRQQG